MSDIYVMSDYMWFVNQSSTRLYASGDIPLFQVYQSNVTIVSRSTFTQFVQAKFEIVQRSSLYYYTSVELRTYSYLIIYNSNNNDIKKRSNRGSSYK